MTEEDFLEQAARAQLTPAQEALVRKNLGLQFTQADIPQDPVEAQRAFETGMEQFNQSGRTMRK